MRLLTAALAGIAIASMTAPPPAPAQAPRGSCSLAGSRTALSTASARVYYTRAGRPYSCYRITGRRVALDMHVDRFYARGDARLGRLRVTGRILAYTWVDPGIPAVYVHSLDMRTARFQRRAKVEPVASADPGAVQVTDLVTRRSGAIAWIQRVEGEVSVWRLDARGRRRLDLHPALGPISLRLVGGRLEWRRGRARRVAPLR